MLDPQSVSHDLATYGMTYSPTMYTPKLGKVIETWEEVAVAQSK